MNVKLIRVRITHDSKGRIGVVTNVVNKDFSIARDITGRGHVVRAPLPRGARVELVAGEWRQAK